MWMVPELFFCYRKISKGNYSHVFLPAGLVKSLATYFVITKKKKISFQHIEIEVVQGNWTLLGFVCMLLSI